MKVTQLSARIDTQVLPEDLPQPAERVQGLRLPPVAVQRHHQLAPSPLTQRTTGHQGLKTAHHLMVAAQRELGIQQVLQRRLAQLLQPQRLRSRERAVGELSQRRTSPKPSARLSSLAAPAGSPPAIVRRPSPIRLSASIASTTPGAARRQ